MGDQHLVHNMLKQQFIARLKGFQAESEGQVISCRKHHRPVGLDSPHGGKVNEHFAAPM